MTTTYDEEIHSTMLKIQTHLSYHVCLVDRDVIYDNIQRPIYDQVRNDVMIYVAKEFSG